MRSFFPAVVALALLATACASPGSPVMPSTGMPSTVTPAPTSSSPLSGTWTGTGTDSSGSMMGSGGPSQAGVSWTITQSGDTLTGVMNGGGMMAGRVTMTGTVSTHSGHTGTITITMPAGSMMGMANHCSAVATGTFDMDDMMTTLHCQYSGSNSCSGPFTHGELHMHR